MLFRVIQRWQRHTHTVRALQGDTVMAERVTHDTYSSGRYSDGRAGAHRVRALQGDTAMAAQCTQGTRTSGDYSDGRAEYTRHTPFSSIQIWEIRDPRDHTKTNLYSTKASIKTLEVLRTRRLAGLQVGSHSPLIHNQSLPSSLFTDKSGEFGVEEGPEAGQLVRRLTSESLVVRSLLHADSALPKGSRYT